MDLYYRRLRMIRRNGRDVLTASVQTVVIFLVDARPCLPTHVEWDLLAEQYKQRYHEESKPADGSEGGSAEATVDASTCESAATATQPEPDPEDDAGACALPADDQPEPEPEDDAEACALPVEEEAVVGAIVKALHTHTLLCLANCIESIFPAQNKLARSSLVAAAVSLDEHWVFRAFVVFSGVSTQKCRLTMSDFVGCNTNSLPLSLLLVF